MDRQKSKSGLWRHLSDSLDSWAPTVIIEVIFWYTKTPNVALLGGQDQSAHSLDTCEIFDPDTNEWSFLPRLLVARDGSAAVFTRGKIYIIGGHDGHYLARMDVLDLTTGTWTELNSMNVARDGFGAIYSNKLIYVFGGKSSKEILNSIEIYNIKANTWDLHSTTLPVGLCQMGVCKLNEKIYIIGGVNNEYETISQCGIFDLNKGVYESIQEMQEERQAPAVCTYNNLLYVFGGYNLETCELYNPLDAKWTYLTPMGSFRSHASVLLAGHTIYLCGGSNGKLMLDTTISFNPVNQKWKKDLPKMAIGRSMHASCLVDF